MPTSKNIEFANHSTETADLLCPRCGGYYLHHLGVRMYERSEDQPTVTIIETDGDSVSVRPRQPADGANPSNRRDGMVIKFECELCSSEDGVEDVIELIFAQHKGSTEVSWYFTPRRAAEV